MPKSLPALSTFLRGLPLFEGLDRSELEMLARLIHCKELARGEILFQQYAPGDAAYIVRTGRISIVLDTEEGRELVINEMGPGDCFGELALLTGEPRSASAVASEPSQILVLARAEFIGYLEKEPPFARRLLAMISRRLGATSERETALAFLNAPARLARALLQMQREQHTNAVVKTNQKELAQRVGVTRQWVAQTLGQWRRAGWIITGRGHIMLLNRAALQSCGRETTDRKA
jgi:CRP/FNR family transcriptional regulator, cyclic AMP receptor protein